MAAPTLTKISPIVGQINAQTVVTLEGSGFSVAGLQVFFGNLLATDYTVVTPDVKITVKTPVVSQIVGLPVIVKTNDGQTAPNEDLVFYFLNLLTSPSYSFSNPYFDPLADYILFGEWKWVRPPQLPGLVEGTPVAVAPTKTPPAGFNYLIVNPSTGEVQEFDGR